MGIGAKIAIAVAAYVGIGAVLTIASRVRGGCPLVGEKTVTLANGTTVRACDTLDPKDVLTWPIALIGKGV